MISIMYSCVVSSCWCPDQSSHECFRHSAPASVAQALSHAASVPMPLELLILWNCMGGCFCHLPVYLQWQVDRGKLMQR
jgi:hypothetical protein